MGIETFRSAGPSSPTRNGVSAGTWDSAPTRHSGRTRNASVPPPKARTPDSFQVTTQLMEDAIPWGGLPVRSGRNQKALFANPFKEDAEEALLIGDGGRIPAAAGAPGAPAGRYSPICHGKGGSSAARQ
jgi:hypothetical protein